MFREGYTNVYGALKLITLLCSWFTIGFGTTWVGRLMLLVALLLLSAMVIVV